MKHTKEAVQRNEVEKAVAIVKQRVESDSLDAMQEKKKMLEEDYVDYTPQYKLILEEYKKSGSSIKFYLCEEKVNKKESFFKVLRLFNDEDLNKKINSLRRFGYTAVLVEEI